MFSTPWHEILWHMGRENGGAAKRDSEIGRVLTRARVLDWHYAELFRDGYARRESSLLLLDGFAQESP